MASDAPWAIWAAPSEGIGWTAVAGSGADPLVGFKVIAGENYGEALTLEHETCGQVIGEWPSVSLAGLVAEAHHHEC